MGSSSGNTNDGKHSLWTSYPLSGAKSDVSIEISNGSVSFPKGVDAYNDFVSTDEVDPLLKEIDQERHIWEGFEQRRKVWRFPIAESSALPSSLRKLIDRVAEQTGYSPKHVAVEEYPPNQLSRNLHLSQSSVTKFESTTLCRCASECKCFVATVPVQTTVVEYLNRPRKRHSDCWDLQSPNHWTGLMMRERTLYIKTDECLWEWRSRITATVSAEDEKIDRIVLVKFYCLPDSAPSTTKEDELNGEDLTFGYVPNPDQRIPRSPVMPPLEEVLTIVVTTSPIKSNPSTELLERTFNTFVYGGPSFAYKCRKVIICDGCRQRDDTVTRRHTNAKQAMRNGIVTSSQWTNYVEFKKALKALCTSATPDSPFYNSTVDELETRHGYGFALRHALQNCVTTPYVMVIQHDRTFMRPTPIQETLQTMWIHENVKYVGMSMRSNLLYRDIFLGKYGRAYMDDMSDAVLRPKELALDSALYGPDSWSTRNMDYSGSVVNSKLRTNIQALIETYRGSQQYADHLTWLELNPPNDPEKTCQLSLSPTFFWYDNVHVCETAHYRDFIFNPAFKMVVRGGFVEDKVSPIIKKTVERLGLKEGHARFGCFLLDDHSGMFFTGHLDGGSYITTEKRLALAASIKSKSAQA